MTGTGRLKRARLPSFVNEMIGGWLPNGFGMLNAHPTMYPLALPIGLALWIFGPLAALVLFALCTGWLCTLNAVRLAQRLGAGSVAAAGIGAFALFNPWVYNEVVAGHLVMVLAYAGIIGLISEMLRGQAASSRASRAVARADRDAAAVLHRRDARARRLRGRKRRSGCPRSRASVVALPSIVGLVAERGTRRANALQSRVADESVRSRRARSPRSADTFPVTPTAWDLVAAIAVWAILALAIAGIVVARTSRAVIAAAAAGAALFLIISGMHGPFAVPYTWIVRNVPESGVFRELYDLAGIFAAVATGAGARRAACAAPGGIRRACRGHHPAGHVGRRAAERSVGRRGLVSASAHRAPRRLRASRSCRRFSRLALRERRRRRSRSRCAWISRRRRRAQRISSDVSRRHRRSRATSRAATPRPCAHWVPLSSSRAAWLISPRERAHRPDGIAARRRTSRRKPHRCAGSQPRCR